MLASPPVTSTALMLSLATRVIASSEQISADVADETVLLSMETGEYYGLNPVAAAIWKHVQEERTVGSIRDALLGEFDGVTEEECTTEVLAFLARLVELGMVEVLG